MGMAPTNWVKDGLDSYLALTGERRAERRAEADLAAQQHSQFVQDQQLQLAQNQDQRAATSAALQNQEAGLRIRESQRRADEIQGTDKQIEDYITWKTAADPSIPNRLDPAEMAAAQQMATDLAHTATLLTNMPEGAAELNVQSLPVSAQKVLMEGPGKAALMRKGIVHKDPATGQEYTMTGELGPVRVVKEAGKSTMVVPTMLAQRPDGTTFEVPYTEGKSNDPSDPVKYVTPEMLMNRAGATLTSLKKAQELGISPAVAYSQSIYKMVMALPYEQRVEWLRGELGKEMARRERYIADAEVAEAAKPYEEALSKLEGTPAERRLAGAALIIGAPSSVVEHLLKTSKFVHDVFPDAKAPKRTKLEEGAGGGLVREVLVDEDTGKRVYEGKPYQKHAPKGSEDKADLQSKRDIAIRLRDAQRGYVTALKSGDENQVATAVSLIRSLNDEAQAIGVAPLKLPANALSSEELDSLRQQADTEARNNRGFVKKFFNLDPSEGEVQQQFERLKRDGMHNNPAAQSRQAVTPQQPVPRGTMAPAPRPPSQQAAAAQGGVNPPAGFRPTGKTVQGMPAYVSPDGKKIWTAGAFTADVQGDSVIVNGKAYKIANGMVVINGQKFRVQ